MRGECAARARDLGETAVRGRGERSKNGECDEEFDERKSRRRSSSAHGDETSFRPGGLVQTCLREKSLHGSSTDALNPLKVADGSLASPRKT